MRMSLFQPGIFFYLLNVASNSEFDSLDDFCSCKEHFEIFEIMRKETKNIAKQTSTETFPEFYNTNNDSDSLVYACRVLTKVEDQMRESQIQGKNGILVFPSIQKTPNQEYLARGTMRYYTREIRGNSTALLTLRKNERLSPNTFEKRKVL